MNLIAQHGEIMNSNIAQHGEIINSNIRQQGEIYISIIVQHDVSFVNLVSPVCWSNAIHSVPEQEKWQKSDPGVSYMAN